MQSSPSKPKGAKVVIQLSKWYAKGNVITDDYNPRLLNQLGQRCCLGFAAQAHGAIDLLNYSAPRFIRHQLCYDDWMLEKGKLNSALAWDAISINDGVLEWADQPLEVRMGNLITIFEEGGDELIFEND